MPQILDIRYNISLYIYRTVNNIPQLTVIGPGTFDHLTSLTSL